MPADPTIIRTLFDELADLPEGDRAARLADLDVELRREVAALLAADGSAAHPPTLDAIRHRALTDALLPSGSRIVGRYRIEGELGAGGMGVIYLAFDTRLERTVALKLLPRHIASEAAARDRFLREARAAAALDHPNICTLYEIDEWEGSLFIAMAYVDGESLAARLKRGPLPVDEAVEIARQIAAGLGRAHASGIVHRDIKPANIMLAADGNVKLVDFGIARMLGAELTRSGELFGTIGYMAPELIAGGEADHRCDLWSLGVVLYEMLAGVRPFDQGVDGGLLHAITALDPQPIASHRPAVPADVTSVVERLLRRRMEERFESAAEVIAALDHKRGGRAAATDVVDRSTVTTLIGREKEIDRICELLATNRILTLTGPTGTGKTCLAIAAAERFGRREGIEVVLIPLEDVRDPSSVMQVIARGLRIPDNPAYPIMESLRRTLAARPTLLILDTFEQLIPAVLQLGELVSALPSIRLIVTSLAPLRMLGEQEFPVPPLLLPKEGAEVVEAEESPAVRLFVERARSVRPDFVLSEENVADVIALCRQLDGIPLAIELAAVRVRILSPRAILARIGRRLDLLKGERLDLPERHRTLRASIDWSYHLLADEGKRFFRRASVFAGGFSLESAEAVCSGSEGDDALEGAAALVEQSLLRREEEPDGEPRFSMLESLRAYGLERLAELGELEPTRRSHAKEIATLAHRVGLKVFGAEAPAALARLEREHDNITAALEWAIASDDLELGIGIAADLGAYLMIRGRLREGRRWFEALFSHPSSNRVDPTLRARGMNGLGTFCYLLGDNRLAAHWLERSLEIWRRLGEPRGAAAVLNDRTWVALEMADFDEAERLANETIALCRESGHEYGLAAAHYNLGWLACYRGEYREARRVLEAALPIYERFGDLRGRGLATNCMGWAELQHGRPDRAAALVDEARRLLEGADDRLFNAWSHLLDAQVSLELEQLDRAEEMALLSVREWEIAGHMPGTGWAHMVAASVYEAAGDAERCDEHLDRADELLTASDCQWGMGYLTMLRVAQSLRQGDRRKASAFLQSSLVCRRELGLPIDLVETLERRAEMWVEGEDAELPTLLLAAAGADRVRRGTPLMPRHRAGREALEAGLRTALGERFEEVWRRGEGMGLDEVVGVLDEREGE